MGKYDNKIKKKQDELRKVKNPKNVTGHINNSIYEIDRMIERNEMFFKRMSQHILNLRGNMYNLIRLVLKGEENIPRYIMTINPNADKFSDFYHVYLGQVIEGGLKSDTWMQEIFDLITKDGIEINDEFIKSFLRIYGKHESPSGFDDPRDSTFVGEWLNAHKGRILRITIW